MKYDRLVSVVMPVHNGEKYLREAIESVLNQTYKNFEFLIIENCSTDSSVDIIKSYDDPRIRLIIEKNCGQVQAYNRGFKEARGEYVFIHDHDDVSNQERFEKQLKYSLVNNIDICGSFIKLIDENGKIISHQEKKISNKDIKRELLFKTTAIHNSAICISKKVFSNIGYWEHKYYPVADCEFFMRASFTKVRFGNIPEYLYKYRRHSLQITAKKGDKALVIFRKYALIHFYNNFQNNNNFYSFKGYLYYYTNNILFAFLYFILAILKGENIKESIKYLVIIVFFGIPLSIVRKTKFIESECFVKIKMFLKEILKF